MSILDDLKKEKSLFIRCPCCEDEFRASMPIVLAEVAYISNDSDRQNLKNEQFRKQAAQGLYNGIIKILTEMAAKNSL